MGWMREKGGRDWFWGLRREMIVLRVRLSVLFMKWEWVDMDGCCWGDGLMMICMIDINELSVCLCFHPQWERERERLNEDWLKSYWNDYQLELTNEWVTENCFQKVQFFKTIIQFFSITF